MNAADLPKTPCTAPLRFSLHLDQRIPVLAVTGPHPCQAVSNQRSVDAGAVRGVDVVKQPAVPVRFPRAGFHPDGCTREFPQPGGGFLVAMLAAFRGINAEESYPAGGTYEGVTINDA